MKDTLDNLENVIKERTDELKKAFNLLKDNEKCLAEAQRISHVGSWYCNIVADEVFWSDEMYSIFGHGPQEFSATYNTFLSHVYPD